MPAGCAARRRGPPCAGRVSARPREAIRSRVCCFDNTRTHQDDHVVLLHADANPLVTGVAHVKVAAAGEDAPNLFVLVQVPMPRVRSACWADESEPKGGRAARGPSGRRRALAVHALIEEHLDLLLRVW